MRVTMVQDVVRARLRMSRFPVPALLRAIPVLTFELNGDGSIRRVEVMRYPSQDRETVNIAIESMRRAAPFGTVSHLPKPWRFNETFLFNNQHKFKPMTLDQL